jgi:hypothetical protein
VTTESQRSRELDESIRHNVETESINRATQLEGFRHNLESERLQQLKIRTDEEISYAKLFEENRHNVMTENEINRHNVHGEWMNEISTFQAEDESKERVKLIKAQVTSEEVKQDLDTQRANLTQTQNETYKDEKFWGTIAPGISKSAKDLWSILWW